MEMAIYFSVRAPFADARWPRPRGRGGPDVVAYPAVASAREPDGGSRVAKINRFNSNRADKLSHYVEVIAVVEFVHWMQQCRYFPLFSTGTASNGDSKAMKRTHGTVLAQKPLCGRLAGPYA